MNIFTNIQAFDLSVVRFIRENFACPFLDFLMPLITYIGEKGIFCLALSFLFIIINRGRLRKTGVVMLIAVSMGFLIGNLLIKPVVMRPRPCWIDSVTLLIENPSDFSFPSGHTLACFETAVPIFLCCNKKWGVFAIAIATAVAFSRLYLYVHFPTDVIVGALLGTVFSFFAKLIVDKIEIKVGKKI